MLPWPELRPTHLATLVDDVGIIEHARGVVPNRSSGYCTDDAARLVLVATGLVREAAAGCPHRVLAQGLAFLWHAWDPKVPGLHNVLSYDRRWVDGPHIGDHLGRAIWALGVVLAEQPGPELGGPAWWLLGDLAPLVGDSTSPREVAYALLGMVAPTPDQLPESAAVLVEPLARRLDDWYRRARTADWRWFEDYLTYDNARLPQALLLAGERLGAPDLCADAMEALDWYAAQCGLPDGPVRLVGNRWRHRSAATAPPDAAAEGDEQALDAAALTEALLAARGLSGEERYAAQAGTAFDWFLGANRLGMPVYDERTGGCSDGLGADALNHNQGAESTLAFYQAFLAVRRAGLDRVSREDGDRPSG